MTKNISKKLICIINSYSNNTDLVNCIYSLLNQKILNDDEKKLCNTILDKIELLNSFNLNEIVKNIDSSIDVDAITDSYKIEEIIEKTDEFIQERMNEIVQVISKKAYKNIANNIYDRETIDFLYNRYPNSINIKKDSTYEELEELDEGNYGISTCFPCIDSYLNGLVCGTVTTIIGNNLQQKNILSLNIAYNAACQKKNVLYISIGLSKKDLYKRFLILHSCSKKHFTKLERNTSYNVLDNNYATIYHDFKENLLNNIKIVDESDYYINTHYSLMKTICVYNELFKKNSKNGIDLIIVDELSKMKLFDGKKYISNKNVIANEFYSFFKNQSDNLLLQGKSIPIVVTYESLKDYRYNEEMNIPDLIYNLSDNVLLISNNSGDVALSRIYVQVFKNAHGEVMNIPEEIKCDYNHWYIENNIFGADAYSTEDIRSLKKENNKLLLENNAYVGNNNIILSKINDIDNKIEKAISKNNSNKEDNLNCENYIDGLESEYFENLLEEFS